MGLFDVNIDYSTDNKKNMSKTDRYEEEAREIKSKRARAIMQLGNMLYEENKNNVMSDSAYSKLFNEINEADRAFALAEKKKCASLGYRLCDNCGAKLSINSVFCNMCGTPQGELDPEVKKASNICLKCGAAIVEGDQFCPECGERL